MPVALLLFAFNQERYVRGAIEAALALGCEVVISDDCSTDGTRAIIEQYAGRAKIRPRTENLGPALNVYAAAEMTDADILMLAAADDLCEPQRLRRTLDTWRGGITCSDFTPIDADGSPVTINETPQTRFDLLLQARGATGPVGATVTMERSLLYPRIEERIAHEDRVFPFRAALRGLPINFLPEKLVRYRVTDGLSRQLPVDQRDYLFRFCREQAERTLPDARQRLRDAIREGAPRNIVKACRATIAELEAKGRMASGRDLFSSLLSGLRQGARPPQLIHHFAKVVRSTIT